MIYIRQEAFNNISRVLAITRYDIEQRQLINEYGLNIHGENFFRDVFNFIYNLDLENDNSNTQNSAYIDLISKKKKIVYQITTQRTKDKVLHTFMALKEKKYKGYTIKIFYLLEKAKLNKEKETKSKEKTITLKEIKETYKINLDECLLDYTDLIKDINNLKQNHLIELNNKYFKKITEKYTDIIVLDIVFKHLINNYSKRKPNYDDVFGNIDTDEKLELNNINERIKSEINQGLDYVDLVNSVGSEDNLPTDLRSFIVDDLYKRILINLLASKISKKELQSKQIDELHRLCITHHLDFNKIINNLHQRIEEKIDVHDFNSMSISWVIIAYFFEICDIGIKEKNDYTK